MRSPIAAVGDDGQNGGVGAVLEGQWSQELLAIDPQGHRGCTQAGGSGSCAPNLPVALAGDTAQELEGTVGLRGHPRGHTCANRPCSAETMAGLYLGCPFRGHSEPLIVTRQLLPAERWVPRRDTRVPPPWGPKLGCRMLMRGSWAESRTAGQAVSQHRTAQRPTPGTRGLVSLPPRGHYHKDEAAEGGGSLDTEARGPSRLRHIEHHISRPCRCRWLPRLQHTHQHVHKVLATERGQRPAG